MLSSASVGFAPGLPGESSGYQAWLLPWALPTILRVYHGFFELYISRIDKIDAHQLVLCRASVSRQPIAAFLFVELLLTLLTKFLAIKWVGP